MTHGRASGWATVLAILTVVALMAGPADAADVTAQVIRETELDEHVAAACRDYCQGNQSRGSLTRVTVVRKSATHFTVRADARLRNRHDPLPNFTAWDYTIEVQAYGTLEEKTCNLRVDRIRFTNDRLGLERLASGEEGQIHHVENCGRFLTGL